MELDHIFCSINGFSSNVTVAELNEILIENIEQFVQEELFDLLHTFCMQQNVEFSDAARRSFFGSYQANPTEFRFTEEEKQLILDLRIHVNRNLDETDISNALSQLCLEDPEDQIQNWFFEDECQKTAHTEQQCGESYAMEDTHTHDILKKLLSNANRNCHRSPAGYRFDRDVKDWAAFIRMLAGRLGYEAIHANLCLSLPSLSTINNYIQNTKVITEGVLRPHELLVYLQQRNLPLTVTISEDATRIQGRVQYDSRSNQLVGFVLPMNPVTGLPTPFAYKARGMEEIVGHFVSGIPTASFVNTIMVQPIAKVPPFCLLLFGTDCRFTSENVSTRWKHVVSELENVNIDVLTIASDSDPKFNSAMRRNSMLGNPSTIFNAEWFSCGSSIGPPFYIQDTTHIGTKLRNFLLKTLRDPAMLPFGKKFHIRLDHLEHLIKTMSKDKHQLTQTVLDPNDRQNFESVLKICDPRVTDLLEKHVRSSEGTVKILEIIRNIIAAFMDPKLKPLERVCRLWYSIFLIRIWRRYVLSEKSLTLKKNFLTNYCYICIELNAHSLVLIILYLRSINKPQLFMPLVYSSQPCESFYRHIRSFTSTYSTVANCTVKEILERINKIQLQNEISSDKSSIFKFPKRLTSCNSEISSPTEHLLPNQTEIFDVIERAKQSAIAFAIEIRLLDHRDTSIPLKCEVLPYMPSVDATKEYEFKRARQSETASILCQLRSVCLKNYADIFQSRVVSKTSPYVEISHASKRIVVKKTSLCWLLRTSEGKLSSDRLKRVQTSTRGNPKHCIKRKNLQKTKKCMKKRNIHFRNLF